MMEKMLDKNSRVVINGHEDTTYFDYLSFEKSTTFGESLIEIEKRIASQKDNPYEYDCFYVYTIEDELIYTYLHGELKFAEEFRYLENLLI